jgi:hypothetical protein
MTTTRSSCPISRLGGWAFCLALAFLAWASPARADGDAGHAARPRISSSSADDGWGARRVARHFRTRTGVVHVCILAVLGALYIMMRKLTDCAPPRAAALPTETLTEEHRDSATQQRRAGLG